MADNENQVGSNNTNESMQKIMDSTAIKHSDKKTSDKLTVIQTVVSVGDTTRSQQQQQTDANAKTDLAVKTVNTPPLLKENVRKRYSSTNIDMPVSKKIAVTPTDNRSKNITSDEGIKERPKRNRRSIHEIACQNFINTNDPNLIFDQLSPNLDRKTILKKYKEKTKDLSQLKVKKEVSEVLKVKLKSNSKLTSSKMTSLENILVEYSNIFGKDFLEAVTNTCGKKLDATQLLEVMKIEDLVAALRKKFKISQLVDMFGLSNNSVAIKKILYNVPDEEIINLLQSKISSEPLTKLLQDLPSLIPEDNGVPMKAELVSEITNGIINLLKSRRYLNNSEAIFNHVLENGPDELSSQTKENIKNLLLKKFSLQNLVNVLHEVIDLCIPSEKDQIIEILDD